MTGLARVGAGVCAGLALLVLAACGARRTVAVSVVSTDENPVPHAAVAALGTRARAVTDQQGSARLPGLRPGVYTVVTSARGYFAQQARLRLTARRPALIKLVYRPPVGTYVWNIGPAGEYWDEGTVTRSTVTATEYDWTCNRDPRTGKEVGSWSTFPGALPYAVAPDTIAPEWVRRGFPASGPPPPPSDCKTT